MTKTPSRSPTMQRGAKAVSRQQPTVCVYIYLFQFQNLNKILKKQQSFRIFFLQKRKKEEKTGQRIRETLAGFKGLEVRENGEEKLKRLGHLLLRFIAKSRYCFYFFFFSLIHLGFVNSMGVCCPLVLPIFLV